MKPPNRNYAKFDKITPASIIGKPEQAVYKINCQPLSGRVGAAFDMQISKNFISTFFRGINTKTARILWRMSHEVVCRNGVSLIRMNMGRRWYKSNVTCFWPFEVLTSSLLDRIERAIVWNYGIDARKR